MTDRLTGPTRLRGRSEAVSNQARQSRSVSSLAFRLVAALRDCHFPNAGQLASSLFGVGGGFYL